MLDEYVNKIKEGYSQNDMDIRKLKSKIHELNLYDFEDRIGRIALLSTLLYMPVFFLLLLSNIPVVFFPGAVLFTSFCLGYVGNLIMEKKAKCKERFKKIFKSKRESKRIEEILKLEMEIERLNLRNEIINRVEAKHNEEVNIIKKFSKSEKFSIEMKKSNYSKDELIKRINELEFELKNKYDLLDKLSDESVIRNQKLSFNDKFTPIFKSMMCAFVPMLLSAIAVFSYTVNPLPEPSMIPFYTTFVPAALTLVSGLTHFSLKKKNTMKAINFITADNNMKEHDAVHFEIDKIKSQITKILLTLNTYKNELENYDLIYEYNREKTIERKNNLLTHNDELSLDNNPKLILK